MPVHPELSQRPLSPHQRRRRLGRPGRTALGTALLLAVTLAACTDGSGNPEPSPPISASTTAPRTSPTPSPTRTGPLLTGPNVRPGEIPPTKPTDAESHTIEGAQALGFYFFKALDWSIATNDSWLLRGLSVPGCAPCKATIDGLDALNRLHRKLVGGRISIDSWGLATGTYKIRADRVVRVSTRQAAQRIEDANHRVVNQEAQSSDTSLVFLNWTGNQWRVVDLGVQK